MTIAQRINGERLVVLGWGRAILMQLAHPLVAAAIDTHSDFDASPRNYIQRMHRTISAMLSLTFGTEAQVQQTANRINAIHQQVKGHLDQDVGPYRAGTPYHATDSDLLTWVHSTIIDSQLVAYVSFVGPLTVREKDLYCAETAAQISLLLKIPPNRLPDTTHALDDYLEEMQKRQAIVIGECARRLAKALLAPPGARWAAPVMWLGRLATVGLLPKAIRDAYGFTWRTRDERKLITVAAMLQALPPVLSQWPAVRRR